MEAPQLCLQVAEQDIPAGEETKAAIYIPPEQIAAKNYNHVWREEHETWRHTYDIPHSCRHCRQFNVISNPKPITVTINRPLDLREEGETAYIRVCIAERLSDIALAMDERCPLFETLFGDYRGRTDSELLETFDIDGSGMVQAVVFGKGKTSFDVEVHGYVDLALIYRRNTELYPYVNWLRAIIQPGKLSLIVRQHSYTCLLGFFSYRCSPANSY